MKLKIFNVASLMVFVFGTFLAHAETGRTALSLSGETIVKAKVASLDVRVVFSPRATNPRFSRSVGGATNAQTVDGQAIRISVNRKELFIPASSIADLGKIREAKIEFRGQDVGFLELQGGDASEGYRVVLEFDANRMRRRRFYSLLMPTKMLQETIYYVQVLADE